MDEGERKRADRLARFRHYANDFASKLARATPEERHSSVEQLHALLKVIDAATKPMTLDEQTEFDGEMQKPWNERSGNWNYPDDPIRLSEQAAALLREAAELSTEAEKMLRDVARIAGYRISGLHP